MRAFETERPANMTIDRTRPLKVFVTSEEREAIKARAAGAGLTVSSYLRATAFNRPIQSKTDADAVDTLLGINADLGRLGGLLKLWLSTRSGQGASSLQVQNVLRELRDTQRQFLSAISGLRRR